MIQAWRQRAHSFTAIAFWTVQMATLQQGAATDMVENIPVSKNLFSLVGLPAHLAPGEVALSHALWHLYLHDQPGLIGQPINLGGTTYTVAAILHARVSFPPGDAALYTLFQPKTAALSSTIPLEHSFEMTMHFHTTRGGPMLATAAMRMASPDLPKVFVIPLLAGRFFNPHLDTTHTPEVAVVNEDFTSAYFPGQKLIGTKKFGYPIIGILANVHGNAVGLPAQQLAFAVTQRTRELGIRTALGAAPADILRLVLGRALWLLALGIASGIALAFALTHLLAAYLYHVPAHDPWSLTAAALLLAACALAAAWLPARRAARISPMEALRCD